MSSLDSPLFPLALPLEGVPMAEKSSRPGMARSATEKLFAGGAKAASSMSIANKAIINKLSSTSSKKGSYIMPQNLPAKEFVEEAARMRDLLKHSRVRHENTGCNLINPDGSSWILKTMDLLTTSAIAYTAIVTPLEVAFLQDYGPIAESFVVKFAINRTIDLIFLVEILMQFFIVRAPPPPPLPSRIRSSERPSPTRAPARVATDGSSAAQPDGGHQYCRAIGTQNRR